jgi:hypothetical protein
MEEVRRQLRLAHLHQIIWTEVRDAATTVHPDADHTFLWSYSQVYVAAITMAIRRVADTEPPARSLGRLITSMLAEPEVMTRERYLAAAPDDSVGEFVWRWATPEDPHHIDPEHMRADLARLGKARTEADRADDETASAMERVLSHADKRLAHMDPGGSPLTMTFAHLREALATVSEIANDYTGLLDYSFEAFDLWAIEGDWHAPLRASLWPEELAAREEWERKYGQFLRREED